MAPFGLSEETDTLMTLATQFCHSYRSTRVLNPDLGGKMSEFQ